MRLPRSLFRQILLAASVAGCACVYARTARAFELSQIISRQSPDYDNMAANMTIGQDGRVYLANKSRAYNGYVLRLERDGTRQTSGDAGPAAWHNITANAAGIVASPRQHFSHSVGLLDSQFQQFANVADFPTNDTQGYDNPTHVEAGSGGDFYALDAYRFKVARISPSGEMSGSYQVPHPPTGTPSATDFRVSEKQHAFWFVLADNLACVGFDGQTRWQYPLARRQFDVDEDGTAYLIAPSGDTVESVSSAGAKIGDTVLQMGAEKATLAKYPIVGLRVWKNEILLRRLHPTEMFQRYAAGSGNLINVVTAKFEKLTATIGSDIWTAGRPQPFQVRLEGTEHAPPVWKVWARPFGTPNYIEMPQANGSLQVPTSAAGLYDVRVTPQNRPLPFALSEYVLQTRVQILTPDSQGTVNVWTPANRVYYGRGESIPFGLSVRGAAAQATTSVALALMDGPRALSQAVVKVEPGKIVRGVIPGVLASALKSGNYTLRATAPDSAHLTAVPQLLQIGNGVRDPGLLLTRYGDYGSTFPADANAGGVSISAWNAPDVTAYHLERNGRLGFNMMVDRLFGLPSWSNVPENLSDLDVLRKSLGDNPTGVAAEKAVTETQFLQTQAGYSANGVRQMFILLNNDSSLPIGHGGFDGRSPKQLGEDITKMTTGMAEYPSFRGWSWAANNWLWDSGASAMGDAANTAKYNAALKAARETGVWDPLLDTVSNTWLAYAPDAQNLFNAVLKPLAPQAVTAWSAPFRNVYSYPPLTFKNVNETDLQAQWEQESMPYHEMFGVDYYKRPGKKAWGHPEVWNDSGTGDQVWTSFLGQIMRGASGTGMSGDVAQWGYHAVDSRQSELGLPSVARSANNLLRQYGPWLAQMQNDDRVAIIADSRMFRLDGWFANTGVHFARVYEAYATCLRAHHAASLVFSEDIGPDTLKKYRAVLLVDQNMQPETELMDALHAAQAAGVTVLTDGTCRPAFVTGFKAMDVKFNRLEKTTEAGDDAVYPQLDEIVDGNLPVVKAALDAVLPPIARVPRDTVLLTQRRAEQGRYVFALNQTPPKVSIGEMWRIGLFVSNRIPVRSTIGLGQDATAVYDAFAMRRLTPANGSVGLDLATLPMRVYAVLPRPIASIALSGPKTVSNGQAFEWNVRVLDASGAPIRAAVPVRLRLLGSDGAVLQERYLSSGGNGSGGKMRAFLNAPSGGQLLEATELLSGQSARLAIGQAAPINLPLVKGDTTPSETVAAASGHVQSLPATASRASAPDADFGLHLRDLAVTGGGSLAVCNAMTWDNNVYGVDTATGTLKWQRKVGSYYAYGPQAVAGGAVVQGFNFGEGEGYSLYQLDAAGTARRRFALYGLPQRMINRFAPVMVHDRINNFAADPAGQWFASAGDLGLAVWDKDGKPLWSIDSWRTSRTGPRYNPTTTFASSKPPAAYLLTLGSDALVGIEGVTATAYQATTGQVLWKQDLAPLGEVVHATATADGKTCALLTTIEGGTVYILRDGKKMSEIPTAGDEVALSPDGETVAVAQHNLLKCYSAQGGLRWTMPGDDTLRSVRFAPDGKRLAVVSPLGTVYVLDSDGHQLLRRDLGTIAAPAWLPAGDLLLATWDGRMMRWDKNFKTVWSTRISPEAPSKATLSSPPLVRMASWTNSDAAPIVPSAANNLLIQPTTQVSVLNSGGRPYQLNQDFKGLIDGKSEAPAQPWLSWTSLNTMAEGEFFETLVLDSFNREMHVTAVTFAEDPKHPESWLRDVYMESWNPTTEKWDYVQSFLSDSALHTHTLTHPIDTAKVRIVLPIGMPGNLRLSEIALHGELLGVSHPDVVAKRPVAVLLDDNPVEAQTLLATTPNYLEAYSGKMSFQVNGPGSINYFPGIGHAMPNWGFDITENPIPGEYRYLQFAWKALSPQTKAMTLSIGKPWPSGGVMVTTGVNPWAAYGYPEKHIAETPPTEWTTVRVDLWDTFKKPTRIQCMMLASQGGPGVFDQVILGKSLADLDATVPLPGKNR